MSVECGAGPSSSSFASKPPRRKSRPSRFSVDYYNFPRIHDESSSDESEAAGGDGANNNLINPVRRRRRSSKRTLYTMEQLHQIRGNRGLQYFATFAANVGAFAFGTALSYPAVALPDLRVDPYFQTILTEGDESWIGAIFALGAVVSGPAAGYSIEKMGRRMSMMVLSVPFFLSWMLINIATDVPMILVGRFLTGFFSGVFLVAAPIFTAEISDAAIRGSVGATFDMSSSVGILFIYIVGAFCSWRRQALICATIPLFIFLLMVFIPESPAYLLEKGRREEAKEVLSKYKGTKDNTDLLMAHLENLQQEVIDSKASESGSIRDLLIRPILIPVSVAMMVFVFQVISGLDPILVYTVDIFKSAGGPNGTTTGVIDEYASAIVFGVIELIAGIMAAFFVDKTGRRFLLLLSEAVMVLSLVALGIFFYLRGIVEPTPIPPTDPTEPPLPGIIENTPALAWLPLASLSVFIMAYSVGLGPVGYLLMGEVLPLRVKGIAGSLLTSAKWLLSFVMTRYFEGLIGAIGESGTFWLFSGFCAIGFGYIYWFVPETNGKSLEDIQRDFRRRFSLATTPDLEETEPLLQNHVKRDSSSLICSVPPCDEQAPAVPMSEGYQSINSPV